MTDQDRPEFAIVLARLATNYREPVTEEHVAFLFEELAGYAVWEVQDAARRHMRTNRFFPTLSEFIELLEDERRDRYQRESAKRRQLSEGKPLNREELIEFFEQLRKQRDASRRERGETGPEPRVGPKGMA